MTTPVMPAIDLARAYLAAGDYLPPPFDDDRRVWAFYESIDRLAQALVDVVAELEQRRSLIAAPNSLVPRPLGCTCNREMGDLRCDVHPTCPDCGRSVAQYGDVCFDCAQVRR